MYHIKIIALSALYFILAVVVLLLLDLGFDYMCQYAAIPFFDWFNGLKTWIKVLSLIFGGVTLVAGVLNLPTALGSLLFMYIFSKLPTNGFTLWSAIVLSWANIIWNLFIIWNYPSNFSFWVVVEMLILSAIAWSFSCAVIPVEEQKEELKKRRNYGTLDADLDAGGE